MARIYYESTDSESVKKLYQGFQVHPFALDSSQKFSVFSMMGLSDLFQEQPVLGSHLRRAAEESLEEDLAGLRKKAKIDLRKVRKALLFFKVAKQTQQGLFDLLAAAVLVGHLQVTGGGEGVRIQGRVLEGQSDV